MSTVAGRYDLRDQLGRGGMATVWRAWDQRLHREVAVKVLAPILAADPGFQARFEREARQVARLSHPNVVTVFDFGSDESTPYLVMELVEGQSLGEKLNQSGSLQADETVAICSAILAGLDEAHRNGIVHRDIKPSNVLLSQSGLVKVADFGVARSLGDSTQLTDTGVLIGTVGYLSPEQCAGERASPRSDIYAVGCLAYQCLVGRPPFVGESAASVMYQHQHSAPVPLIEIRPDVPAGLASNIEMALNKDPELRYSRASDMRSALLHEAPVAESLAFAAPVDQVQTLAFEQTRHLTRLPTQSMSQRIKKSWWVIAASLIVLALVGAGIFALTQKTPKSTASGLRAKSHHVSGGASSSSSNTTTTSSSAAPASSASETVTLPVIACDTSYGYQDPNTPPPSQMQASLPTSFVSSGTSLSFYALGDNEYAVLGPRGWDCIGSVGADGSSDLTVVPPSEDADLRSTAGLSGSQDPEVISVGNNGGCAGCGYTQACGLFPQADTSYAQSLGGCTTPPPGETVTNLTPSVVAFEDPPGVKGTGQPSVSVNPTNGIMTFSLGPSGNQPNTFLMTCELPDSEHTTCTATLNQFVRQYWPQ